MTLAETVKGAAGAAVLGDGNQKGKPTLVFDAARGVDVFAAAKAAGFDHLADLTAVDWPEGRPGDDAKAPVFQVVYNLYSYKARQHLCLVAYVPRDAPRVASAVAVWPAADWHERECFDLYGVVFDGHPNLTRIMLPDDWQGHPLRKDYDLTKEQFIYREGPDDRVTTDPSKGW